MNDREDQDIDEPPLWPWLVLAPAILVADLIRWVRNG